MGDNNNQHNQDRIEEVRKTLAAYYWNYPEKYALHSGANDPKLYGQWSSVVEMVREEKPNTPMELIGKIGKELFLEFSDVNTAGMVGNELKYLKELWYEYFRNAISNKGLDDEKIEFMATAKTKLAKYANHETGNVEEAFKAFDSTRTQIRERGSLGIPIIHDQLNSISMGGVIPGSIWVVGGLSGSGKSKFTYSMIPDLLDRGFKVAYFTLEIPKEFLLAHVVATKLDRPADEMFRSSWEPSMWEELKNLSVFSGMNDASDIARTIREGAYDFAFIDHLQLVRSPGESRVVEQENVAGKIMGVALETKCNIICVSQISMASKMEAGGDQNLRGSGSFRDNASLIAMINRERDGSGVSLTISKNRYGPSGMRFRIDGNWASGKLSVKSPDVFN